MMTTPPAARRSNQLVPINRLHTEQIDDSDQYGFFLELLVGCQRFEDGYTARNHKYLVLVALPEDFVFPDLFTRTQRLGGPNRR
jgi:hypothetical protein